MYQQHRVVMVFLLQSFNRLTLEEDWPRLEEYSSLHCVPARAASSVAGLSHAAHQPACPT